MIVTSPAPASPTVHDGAIGPTRPGERRKEMIGRQDARRARKNNNTDSVLSLGVPGVLAA